MRKLLIILTLCFGITGIGGNCLAKDVEAKIPIVIDKSMGQTVYITTSRMDFSYYQDSEGQQLVDQRIDSKIFIRNTDPNNQIIITSIEIYDQAGIYQINLIDNPVTLNALASTSYGMPSEIPFNLKNIKGGFCTLVTWQADTYVNQPKISSATAVSIPDGFGRRITSLSSQSGQIIE